MHHLVRPMCVCVRVCVRVSCVSVCVWVRCVCARALRAYVYVRACVA